MRLKSTLSLIFQICFIADFRLYFYIVGKDSINMQTVIIAAAVAGAFVIIGILAALIIYRVCSRRKERQLQEHHQRQYNLYVDPAIALNDLTLTQNNTESETPSQYYNM